jgi:hypothetical protein
MDTSTRHREMAVEHLLFGTIRSSSGAIPTSSTNSRPRSRTYGITATATRATTKPFARSPGGFLRSLRAAQSDST